MKKENIDLTTNVSEEFKLGYKEGKSQQKKEFIEMIDNQRVRKGIEYMKGWEILEELKKQLEKTK